jgi:hypothetical protein
MKEHFDRNMDKFEVYCMRNIFVPPAPMPSSSSASSSSPAGGKMTLETATQQVEEMRIKYEAAKKKHAQMTIDLKMGENLLKEMKSAHFRLMVATQILDEHNVNPLEDSMALLNENKNALQELCGKAYTLTKQMESYLGDLWHEDEVEGGGGDEGEWGSGETNGGGTVGGGGGGESGGAGGVRITGTSDIQNVANQIKGFR